MHASCTICGDIFTGIHPEEIRTTQCGHMFHHQCLQEWINRSKSCPQCRSKVNEKTIIKLYFQLSSYPTQDSGTLENTVENLKFQLKMKEMEVNKVTEESTKMKDQVAGLKQIVMEAEEKNRNSGSEIRTLKDKIKVLNLRVKSIMEEKLRADELQKEVNKYSNIDKILNGSAADAAEAIALMKDGNNPEILCTLIATLRRETQAYKVKSQDLQNLLKFKESKLSSALAEISNLEKQISILNRTLIKVKEDLASTEKENENLKENCAKLTTSLQQRPSASIRDLDLRRINEYPIPDNLDKSSTSLDKSTPSTSAVPSPITPTKLNTLKDSRQRFMLNKRRLPPSTSSEPLPCYDGLGGHLKEEVPLTDRATLLQAIERRKAHKIPLNTKRFKFSSKPEPPKSNLLKFYTKKT